MPPLTDAHSRPSPDQLITFMRSVKPLDSANEDVLREAEKHARWQTLASRTFLMRQDDPLSCVYLLVSGKLRYEVRGSDGSVSLTGHFNPGDLIGEVGLLKDRRAAATVFSVRDSQLLALDWPIFQTLLLNSPSTLMSITSRIIRQADQSLKGFSKPPQYSSIALVPLHNSLPISGFSEALAKALSAFASTACISRQKMEASLGKGRADLAPGDKGFSENLAWLARLDADYQVMLYQAEVTASAWSEQCLRQADRVIFIGNAGIGAELTPVEHFLARQEEDLRPSSELVLLSHGKPHGATTALSARKVERHHHVCLDKAEDFARLARKLMGKSIGLALGGGGIRAASQIGVIRALNEARIPIDLVGGTSIGSLIGALYANGMDTYEMERIIRDDIVKANLFNDYTLPAVSLVKGRKFSTFLRELIGDDTIEDMVLDYFCVATNLTDGSSEVFDRGRAWEAVRASASLPGILPPFSRNGKLYLDGGLLDNLPGEVMRRRGAGKVMALDVSAATKTEGDVAFAGMLNAIGTAPSVWTLLRNRFAKPRKEYPRIGDVIVRSMVLGSRERDARVKGTSDIYVRLPVDPWKMLDFKAASELVEVGYRYASEHVEKWKNLLR